MNSSLSIYGCEYENVSKIIADSTIKVVIGCNNTILFIFNHTTLELIDWFYLGREIYESSILNATVQLLTDDFYLIEILETG